MKLKDENFAIFGAQTIAYGIYIAIKSIFGIKPKCFLVGNPKGNPASIEGIEVRTIENSSLNTKDSFILVAVTELLHAEIGNTLAKNGFNKISYLTAHLEHLLMSEYYNSISLFPSLEHNPVNPKIGAIGVQTTIYEARNHRDVPLKNLPKLERWEVPIQAGAVLTDKRIADLTDDKGENISHKNKMYSEMTATYFVWKNTRHKYKGICHYRRHFVLSREQINGLAENGVDAVLPLPYICYPNSLSQFGRFVSEPVKDLLLDTLKKLHPENFAKYQKILNEPYFYPYNLVLAKSSVFDDYCQWIFSILESMESFSAQIPEIAQTRALSYCAEILTSVYFLANKNALNIRHVEKRIFV
jgi:hypothetical protein